jgi:hypothetical protein
MATWTASSRERTVEVETVMRSANASTVPTKVKKATAKMVDLFMVRTK